MGCPHCAGGCAGADWASKEALTCRCGSARQEVCSVRVAPPRRTLGRVNIRVSAVVLRDERGQILMVRKRGTSMWMNPGGKPEPGESAVECAAREVAEELGLRLDPARLLPLGEFAAPAANEAGFTVVADVFDWPEPVSAPVIPTAEIEEIRWVNDDDLYDDTLAPLFIDHIIPAIGGVSAR